jgi:hypothetical protein
MFEERLFNLVGVLHRITDPLMAENIPHELIGGLAVLIHVEEADPTHSTLTRHVDLMIRCPNLEKVKKLAAQHGFHFRHAAGLDMLLQALRKVPGMLCILFSAEKGSGRIRPRPIHPFAPKKKSYMDENCS